jgi:hypothetical protein
MSDTFLSQKHLARRWCISHRTLERWRWQKQGPVYLRVGGAIRYRLADVEEFERQQLRHAKQNAILGTWR